MKARTFIRIGTIAVALGAVGFVLAVGVLTLVFAPKAGEYAPTSSSDAASWIQAIGSIGAIIGAFLIGERQAKREYDKLEYARERAEQDKQEAQLAVMVLLHDFSKQFEMAYERDQNTVRAEWSTGLKNNVRAALNAFDATPLHEMKSGDRIMAAAEVRGEVQSLYDITASWANRPITTPDQDSEQEFQTAKSQCQFHLFLLEMAWSDVGRLWPNKDS